MHNYILLNTVVCFHKYAVNLADTRYLVGKIYCEMCQYCLHVTLIHTLNVINVYMYVV